MHCTLVTLLSSFAFPKTMQPGAYLAPNWVYSCDPASQASPGYLAPLCVTQALSAQDSVALDASCALRSDRCVDALTRGLLSGLQPLLSPQDTLFPEEYKSW
jgi:hypothetical protein